MDSNLVGAAGFYIHVQQGKLAIGCLQSAANDKMRDCCSATLAAGGHTGWAQTVATDFGSNGSLLRWPATHQCDVSLPHLTRSKLCGQFAMCFISLRHNHQSTG